MTRPKVSIVIATYKSKEDHFICALDSALGQSYKNIEILVNDDSPTDELKKLVLSRHDQRIIYQHNHPPLGPARNHWNAFSKAKGDYITILNHDDLLSSEFVEQLISYLDDNPECVLAFCDHWIIDGKGDKQFNQSDEASKFYGRSDLPAGACHSFDKLVMSQAIPMAMGSLFRRSSLPKELPSAGPAYDLWLTFLLARTGDPAFFVPKRLSSWRNHEDNTTSGGGVAWLDDSARCWLAVSNDPFFNCYRTAALSKSARAFLACSIRQWKNTDRLSSFHYALFSLRINFSFKALIISLIVLWLPFKLVPRVRL
jgi:glycosyltransferase involved in cell wall biosynthesis